MKIEISASGTIYTNRFQGHFKTSLNLLSSDLAGGCYNDSHPSPVTSVTLQIDPGGSQKRIDAVYSVLAQAGWNSKRIATGSWWKERRK